MALGGGVAGNIAQLANVINKLAITDRPKVRNKDLSLIAVSAAIWMMDFDWIKALFTAAALVIYCR